MGCFTYRLLIRVFELFFSCHVFRFFLPVATFLGWWGKIGVNARGAFRFCAVAWVLPCRCVAVWLHLVIIPFAGILIYS